MDLQVCEGMPRRRSRPVIPAAQPRRGLTREQFATKWNLLLTAWIAKTTSAISFPWPVLAPTAGKWATPDTRSSPGARTPKSLECAGLPLPSTDGGQSLPRSSAPDAAEPRATASTASPAMHLPFQSADNQYFTDTLRHHPSSPGTPPPHPFEIPALSTSNGSRQRAERW